VEGEEAVVLMGTFVLMSGVAVIWMAMRSRRHIREMEHRERLAMIERGLLPAPEVDPAAFERRLAGTLRSPESPAAVRARSSGVIMIAIGLAFMFMISFAAGEPGVGIGIGGGFALVGAGFFVNSLLMSRGDGTYEPGKGGTYEPGKSDGGTLK
jgi:hypothetical protein